ncbi:hypothetical protein [Aliarcobacter butzleri]|uniref:hypothetical protein n=1 Tax=Aliarcobacter butzleri TaxID=28197 RepID=UPI0021B1A14E|nr:hypothetical protein [Aliarcobacter butzleri]MCT7646836.1 hypothetical protein [Aliarcobacter butzleri]
MIDIKKLFLSVFFIGILIICILGYLNYTLTPLILTIVLMFSYYLIAANQLNKKKTISYEQFADSNYYLGFLFTLGSLSITLINLVKDNDMEMLISQFGIAIITTLIGLTLRIYTINFIPNEETNRESFDFIISRKLQMIDDQITQTIDRNKLFSDVLDEKINMFQAKTEENINQFTTNLLNSLDVDKIASIVNNITDTMMKNYNKQTEILEKLIQEIKKVNSNYINNIENVNTYISKNQNFLETFVLSINEIKDKLANYTEIINDTTNNYNKNILNLNNTMEKQILNINENQELVLNTLINGITNVKNENSELLNTFKDDMMKSLIKNTENNSQILDTIKIITNELKVNKDTTAKMQDILNELKDKLIMNDENMIKLSDINDNLKLFIKNQVDNKPMLEDIRNNSSEIKNLLTLKKEDIGNEK